MNGNMNFNVSMNFFDEAYEDTKAFLKEREEWENCDLMKLWNVFGIMIYLKPLNDYMHNNSSEYVVKFVLENNETKESETTDKYITKASIFDEAYKRVKENLQETNEWENADVREVLESIFNWMCRIELKFDEHFYEFIKLYLENEKLKEEGLY